MWELLTNILFIFAGGFALWVLVQETKKTIDILKGPKP